MSLAFSPPLHTLSTASNLERLGRFFAIERELMRVQGARMPDLESWFLKQKIGYFLFEDAGGATQLQKRRAELPGGRREAAPLDDAMRAAIQSALFEKGDAAFCAALYLGFKPLLVAALKHHLEASTTVSDAPSRQILQLIIADTERQCAWMEGALTLMQSDGATQKAVLEAIEKMGESVVAAGGITGENALIPAKIAPMRAYQVALDARREARQKTTLDFEPPQMFEDETSQSVFESFAMYFREMAAAETVAVLLWEAPQTLPWEFFADSARHFWDEIRHCQAGQQRLQQMGLDIWQVPVQTGNYNIRARMPLLERYAFITQVEEAGSFVYKTYKEAQFRAAGDAVSADMVAYDMADERMHVRFGTKWLPELQKSLGDTRSMDELVGDARALHAHVMAELRVGPVAAKSSRCNPMS